MKLTVLTDRSGDRSVVRFREVHALAAGETYSPLVVDGVPGADLATLQVKLYRPSETLPSPAVQDPPLAVSLSPAERVMDGVAMTTLQLNSQAIADWYSDVLSSVPSPSSASSTSPGLRPADFTSRVATAILEISDASHGVWTYAPVPLILRPLAVGLPVVGVDGQDGVSPVVTLSRFSGTGGSGVSISVTDANGTSTERVYDGQPPVAPSASAAGVPADAAATYEAVAAKADAAALAAEAAARRAADSALSARIDALPDPYAKSETYSRSQVDTLLSAKQAALDGDQMAAVDSGVTASTVADVATLQAAVASKASSSDLSTAVSRISAAETRLDAIIAAGPVYPDPETGKINERFLPSYVDDVVEAANFAGLPAQGEPGKIYVALDTNLTYRWSGSAYVEISQSLALGETASTAFPGDRGLALEDGKAAKAEMSVTPGTGADADKVTIQLKTGASATVLTQHSPVDPTLTAGGTNAVQGRAVKAAIDAKCSIADVTAVAQAPWTLECGNPDTWVRFGNFYEDPAPPPSYPSGPLRAIYFDPPSGSDATSYSVVSPHGGVEWVDNLENPEWSMYMAYPLYVEDSEGAQFSGQAAVAADGSAVVQLVPVLPEGESMPSWWADVFGSSLTLRRAASANVNGLARLADLPAKTSDLTNDGPDGVHPFISQNEVQHQQLALCGPNHDGFSAWTIKRDGVDVTSQVGQQPVYYASESVWLVERSILPGDTNSDTIVRGEGADATSLSWGALTEIDGQQVSIPYTATRTVLAGYVLGTQTDKPLQPQGEYAVKSEMSVTPGTGANADKTTIQLKTGTSATVLTSHQTWSDVKPSGGIPKTDLASAVQTSLGLADTAVQPSGLADRMPMYMFDANPTVTEGTVSWAYSTNAVDGYVITDAYADGPEYVSDMSDFGGSATAGWIIVVANPEDGADTKWMFASGDESAASLTFSSDSISGTIAATKSTAPTLTVSPYTVATCTAGTAAATFNVAVGAGVTGKARDCILVIDCTATGAVAPTVTWDTHFHPRTDTATDLAIVEEGKRAVFYISEYAPGEFAVGGWQETAGGSAT